MIAKLFKKYLLARGTLAALNYLHLDWLMAGLIVIFTGSNLVAQRVDLSASMQTIAPVLSAMAAEPAAERDGFGAALTGPMRVALDHVARRFRVSNEALEPVFFAAQVAGRERNIDPMLLIAMISVESGFNPYSQSVVGAQGLMQIIPRYHQDKVPDDAGDQPFLDPVINVRIGAHVLQEAIRRQGSLMTGLQQYGGAIDDAEQAYANKVLSEKSRLDQLTRRRS